MFLEFPTEESLFAIASQFMFGESILVSPKVDAISKYLYPITTLLPTSANWYDLNTKMLENRSSPISQLLGDKAMGVWIKAGSILPILNHQNELSLLRAIVNPIRLEIYLDNGVASGALTLDDGWSTKLSFSTFVF